MRLGYRSTMYACFIGYIVQAIVNNFVPLLFVTLQESYDLSLAQIAGLVTFNFGVQLTVDLLSAGLTDKIGYRKAICAAHILAAAGLALLAFLPDILPVPYVGILISVFVYAIGGGLLEVLVSPIVEACPSDNKEKAMSLLHSFYCWGHVGVVLVSTLFFAVFGIENYKLLALIWAVIPALNTIYFMKVPIEQLNNDGEGLSIKELFVNKTFLILMLLMLCAGASEQAVSQWASAFAEKGLGVGKAAGDLAGPLLFAVMMGSSRAVYGKYGDKIPLERFMTISGVLCAASYMLISFSPIPMLGFVGCALCGASVGIMWPGTFSLGAKNIKGGGTAMFAFFALAGDAGCGLGPGMVGVVSDIAGGSLNTGIASAIIFPLLLIIFIPVLCKMKS